MTEAAAELIDHVPYVPTREETPRAWVPFCAGAGFRRQPDLECMDRK